jgi:hypothetical protein
VSLWPTWMAFPWMTRVSASLSRNDEALRELLR